MSAPPSEKVTHVLYKRPGNGNFSPLPQYIHFKKPKAIAGKEGISFTDMNRPEGPLLQVPKSYPKPDYSNKGAITKGGWLPWVGKPRLPEGGRLRLSLGRDNFSFGAETQGRQRTQTLVPISIIPESNNYLRISKTGQATSVRLLGHTDMVTSVGFSPDGNRIASGSSDSTVRLWVTETGQGADVPFKAHTSWVTPAPFLSDASAKPCRLHI